MPPSLNHNFTHHDQAALGEPVANMNSYLVEVDVTVSIIVPVDALDIEDAKDAVNDKFIAECFNTHQYVHLGVIESTIESVEPRT